MWIIRLCIDCTFWAHTVLLSAGAHIESLFHVSESLSMLKCIDTVSLQYTFGEFPEIENCATYAD